MKKYFLHNGTENSGPFDLEELKAKRITKTTPVWHEGLEDWKTAGEIEELRSVLAVVPPPIKPITTVPPILKEERKPEHRTILGLSKSTFFAVFGILVLIVGTGIFNTYQENRSEELERKNHKTEAENRQFELQQKEIEEQKILLAEQEKAETQRMASERKQTISNRLLEIQKTLVDHHTNLEETKKKLDDATAFKLFRTTSERDEEISLLQNDIDYWQSEIEKLEKETNQLNLELEKIR